MPAALSFCGRSMKGQKTEQTIRQLKCEIEQADAVLIGAATSTSAIVRIRPSRFIRDSIKRPFNDSPIVASCFFHEEIIPSAKKKKNTYDKKQGNQRAEKGSLLLKEQ